MRPYSKWGGSTELAILRRSWNPNPVLLDSATLFGSIFKDLSGSFGIRETKQTKLVNNNLYFQMPNKQNLKKKSTGRMVQTLDWLIKCNMVKMAVFVGF